MKVQTVKLIQQGDVEGAPEWLGQLLGPLNSSLEQLNAPLQKQLSHKDNFNSESRDLVITPEVEFSIRLQTLRGIPKHVRCTWANCSDYPLLTWRVSTSDSRIVIATIKFFDGFASPVAVRILFEGD